MNISWGHQASTDSVIDWRHPPVFYNTSKNRTSGELTDLLYNEISHMLIL